jgi:MFS family permease
MTMPRVGVLGRFDVQAAVAITLIVQAAISLLAACAPVLAPEIARERGWDVTLVAFYPALICLTQFLICFLIPTLLRQLGGMGVSLACIGVSAIGLACLLAPSLYLVALTPLAIGLAAGGMNPASSQVLGPRTSARTAGLIMSIKQTGVPLGAMLAGILVPILVLHSGWHLAVVELAMGGVALAALVLPLVEWLNGPSGATAPFRPLEPASRLVAMPGMLNLLVAGTAYTGMQLCLRSFFTVYLVRNLGYSLGTAGLAFGVSQAAGIVGQILWATLSDRLLSAHTVMATVGAVMTVAAALTAALRPDWPTGGVVAVAALYGLSAAGFLPTVLGELARRAPPNQAGALTSGVQLFFTPAILVGPLIFGAVASVLDYPMAFLVLAACTLAGAISAAAGRRNGATNDA